MTTIVNLYKSEYDVYIGRDPRYGDTKWGNPFKDPLMPLHEKLQKYEEYVTNSQHLMDSLGELKGKKLGCTCKPKPCHGDVLVKLTNQKFGGEPVDSEFFAY